MTRKTARPCRILVVEDSPINAFILEGLFVDNGCEVAVVDDGKKAVEWAFEFNPDMIVMDIQMPIMDGFEAARKLRAAGFTRPLLACTTLNDPQNKRLMLEAGFNDVFVKPIVPALLLAAISDLLSDTARKNTSEA